MIINLNLNLLNNSLASCTPYFTLIMIISTFNSPTQTSHRMNTLSKTGISTLHLEQNIGLQEDVHNMIRDVEVEFTVVFFQ